MSTELNLLYVVHTYIQLHFKKIQKLNKNKSASIDLVKFYCLIFGTILSSDVQREELRVHFLIN